MVQTVAFIGLGNMGLGMATNLARAGCKVRGFDISDENLDKAVAAGCTKFESVASAVAQADIVITMLPAGNHVRSVYCGADGVFAHACKSALLVDCSTIDVMTARAVMAEAEMAGFAMIDAPVSGGVMGAQAGQLTFMCGGTEAAFNQARPFLEFMGRNIFHAGGAGNGQAAKICNNMLLGIHMIGTCEAFILAEKLGLEAQTFFDISSVASGQNWSLTSYCPVPGPVPLAPSNREYAAGFAAAMMLKDLRLASQAASDTGAPTPLGKQAEALYTLMAVTGKADLDFSAIIKYLTGKL